MDESGTSEEQVAVAVAVLPEKSEAEEVSEYLEQTKDVTENENNEGEKGDNDTENIKTEFLEKPEDTAMETEEQNQETFAEKETAEVSMDVDQAQPDTTLKQEPESEQNVERSNLLQETNSQVTQEDAPDAPEEMPEPDAVVPSVVPVAQPPVSQKLEQPSEEESMVSDSAEPEETQSLSQAITKPQVQQSSAVVSSQPPIQIVQPMVQTNSIQPAEAETLQQQEDEEEEEEPLGQSVATPVSSDVPESPSSSLVQSPTAQPSPQTASQPPAQTVAHQSPQVVAVQPLPPVAAQPSPQIAAIAVGKPDNKQVAKVKVKTENVQVPVATTAVTKQNQARLVQPTKLVGNKPKSAAATDDLSTLATAALTCNQTSNGVNTSTVEPVKKDPVWCDVGIIKGTSCFVNSYYEPNYSHDPEHESITIDSLPDFSDLFKLELEPGTAYKFRVAAINSCGRGPWSEVSAFKTCLPGYPGAPSSIKISKSAEGAHLSWEPPSNPAGNIIEYSVCLAVRNNTQQQGEQKTHQLAFVRVYSGPQNQTVVPNASLAAAHIDTTSKPAIIFRIAAKNEKGFGPATQVRWLQDVVAAPGGTLKSLPKKEPMPQNIPHKRPKVEDF